MVPRIIRRNKFDGTLINTIRTDRLKLQWLAVMLTMLILNSKQTL